MEKFDVIICGAGLAGGSLGIQLLNENPDLRLAIVDRQQYPLAHAAHKVGESTVEIGAHYLSEVVGLKDHLQTRQLPKFGLRYFFRNSPETSFEKRLEVGARKYFSVPSYQIDRGSIENEIKNRLEKNGAAFFAGSTIKQIRPASAGYEVTVSGKTLKSDKIVDASGRTGLLSRRLGLKKLSTHNASAVWWRVNSKIDVGSFSSDADWSNGFKGNHERWFSTNHLMGDGYWIWLIPLAGEVTSVGIVFDNDLLPDLPTAKYKDCLEWLRQNEPLLAAALPVEQETLLDFRFIKNFSHDCERVFSSEGWMLTGDAGVFLDPFYSPGSDFIAMSNTFITSIIGEQDIRTSTRKVEFYNLFYRNVFHRFLQTYQNKYQIFGNPLVMPVKVVWDFAVYWAFLAFFFLQGKVTCYHTVTAASSGIERLSKINTEMQQFFVEWSRAENPNKAQGMIDLTTIPALWYLNETLTAPYSAGGFRSEFKNRCRILESMAAQIVSFREARTATDRVSPSFCLSENVVSLFLQEIADGCVSY